MLLKWFCLDSTDEFILNATAEHVNTSRCFEALYRGKDGWKYSYRTEPEKQWFLCPPHGTWFIKSVWKQRHSKTSDSVVSFPDRTVSNHSAFIRTSSHPNQLQVFHSCRTMGLKSAEMLDCMKCVEFMASRAEEFVHVHFIRVLKRTWPWDISSYLSHINPRKCLTLKHVIHQDRSHHVPGTLN